MLRSAKRTHCFPVFTVRLRLHGLQSSAEAVKRYIDLKFYICFRERLKGPTVQTSRKTKCLNETEKQHSELERQSKADGRLHNDIVHLQMLLMTKTTRDKHAKSYIAVLREGATDIRDAERSCRVLSLR